MSWLRRILWRWMLIPAAAGTEHRPQAKFDTQICVPDSGSVVGENNYPDSMANNRRCMKISYSTTDTKGPPMEKDHVKKFLQIYSEEKGAKKKSFCSMTFMLYKHSGIEYGADVLQQELSNQYIKYTLVRRCLNSGHFDFDSSTKKLLPKTENAWDHMKFEKYELFMLKDVRHFKLWDKCFDGTVDNPYWVPKIGKRTKKRPSSGMQTSSLSDPSGEPSVSYGKQSERQIEVLDIVSVKTQCRAILQSFGPDFPYKTYEAALKYIVDYPKYVEEFLLYATENRRLDWLEDLTPDAFKGKFKEWRSQFETEIVDCVLNTQLVDFVPNSQ